MVWRLNSRGTAKANTATPASSPPYAPPVAPGNVSLHLGEKLEGLRQAGGDDAREEQGGGSGNAGGSGSVVELKFQGHDKPVTASVVVGADGYWSKVRAAALQLPGDPATQRSLAACLLWEDTDQNVVGSPCCRSYCMPSSRGPTVAFGMPAAHRMAPCGVPPPCAPAGEAGGGGRRTAVGRGHRDVAGAAGPGVCGRLRHPPRLNGVLPGCVPRGGAAFGPLP
jgi:hypothetical protein